MATFTGLFRITQDAELRFLPNGDPIATVSMAYNYGTKKDERGYLPSQFIEAGLWGKRAEALAQYLTKGQKIYAVLSSVHIETFQKRDGSPGHKLTGRIDEIEFAGGRQEGEQSASRQQEQGMRQQQPTQAGSGFDDDMDIPFN